MQRRTFLTVTTLAGASGLTTPALGESAGSNPQPFTVKAGEARFGVHTPFRGINGNDLKVSGKDTNGQLAVFEYVGRQKIGPTLHVHHDQDEIFSIVEGEYLFQIGDQQFTAKAGDTVFGPRNVPHTWVQRSDVGKMTYFVQPAGNMEEFFLKMNDLNGPPTEELIQRMHKEHGMTVLGPPLVLK